MENFGPITPEMVEESAKNDARKSVSTLEKEIRLYVNSMLQMIMPLDSSEEEIKKVSELLYVFTANSVYKHKSNELVSEARTMLNWPNSSIEILSDLENLNDVYRALGSTKPRRIKGCNYSRYKGKYFKDNLGVARPLFRDLVYKYGEKRRRLDTLDEREVMNMCKGYGQLNLAMSLRYFFENGGHFDELFPIVDPDKDNSHLVLSYLKQDLSERRDLYEKSYATCYMAKNSPYKDTEKLELLASGSLFGEKRLNPSGIRSNETAYAPKDKTTMIYDQKVLDHNIQLREQTIIDYIKRRAKIDKEKNNKLGKENNLQSKETFDSIFSACAQKFTRLMPTLPEKADSREEVLEEFNKKVYAELETLCPPNVDREKIMQKIKNAESKLLLGVKLGTTPLSLSYKEKDKEMLEKFEEQRDNFRSNVYLSDDPNYLSIAAVAAGIAATELFVGMSPAQSGLSFIAANFAGSAVQKWLKNHFIYKKGGKAKDALTKLDVFFGKMFQKIYQFTSSEDVPEEDGPVYRASFPGGAEEALGEARDGLSEVDRRQNDALRRIREAGIDIYGGSISQSRVGTNEDRENRKENARLVTPKAPRQYRSDRYRNTGGKPNSNDEI